MLKQVCKQKLAVSNGRKMNRWRSQFNYIEPVYICILQTRIICIAVCYRQGFPGGSVVKNLPANTGDVGLIPGSERFPGEGNGIPLQYSSLEKSHGQKSLQGQSPGGHKESDETEGLSVHFAVLSTGRLRKTERGNLTPA